MKKVLLFDPLSFYGHVSYNLGVIEAVSSFCRCDVVVNKNLASNLKKKGVKSDCFLYTYPTEWGIESLSKKWKSKIIYHLLSKYYFFVNVIKIRKSISQYDLVLITSIDIFLFSILSHFIKGNIAVVDHDIGQIKEKKMYRLAWTMCSKKMKVVVLEEYIKDMFLSIFPSKKVFVVRHPLPSLGEFSNKSFSCSNKLFLPPEIVMMILF